MVFVAETRAARQNRPSLPGTRLVVRPGPSNLGLEGDGIPAMWQGVVAERYPQVISASRVSSPRGGPTVRLSRMAPWRWGETKLEQKISAQQFQGKRLKFSAALRTEVVEVGAGALLFLRFLTKPVADESDLYISTLTIASSSPQPVQNPQWAAISVEADVLEPADTVVLGLVLTGNGTAWFGDLEFSEITQGN